MRWSSCLGFVLLFVRVAALLYADGKYWRIKSIFGSAAQYFNQTRETVEQLDCVMDRVSINLR
jgi:hypothetical protein